MIVEANMLEHALIFGLTLVKALRCKKHTSVKSSDLKLNPVLCKINGNIKKLTNRPQFRLIDYRNIIINNWFSALQTSRVLHISMNTQLTYESIVL